MATQVQTKVVSIGSFPELLRRSRFASFDPTIRQSYGTPPSHLHRGNWGLKRPIAQRKRNAFISLKNFEEHEQYIEWNNAETQVRLIDKIEEINIAPRLVPHVSWYVGLGPAASSYWSKMDTEFAPGETGMPNLPTSVPLFTTQLEGLGLRGKGEYGMKPSTQVSDDGFLHPNVRAMSSKVFKRYLKKLRSLRPEFQKFLKENDANTSFRESGIPRGNLHVRFLGQHFDKQFQDAHGKKEDAGDKEDAVSKEEHPNQIQPIRQQPHRLGGLMYSSPTSLESFFNSKVQSGIVLEDGSATFYTSVNTANAYLVSTAGMIGRLEQKRAGPNVKPAFNSKGLAFPPAALLARKTAANTFIKVKVVDIQLERLPAAVTAFPTNSAREVGIRMELASDSYENYHWRTNTHPPGSMLYNVPEDSLQQQRTKNIFITSNRHKNMYTDQIKNKLRRLDPENEPHAKGNGTNSGNAAMYTLGKLQTMHRRDLKDRWQDGPWILPPNPNDGGDTGQDNGTTGV
jgi:Mitochondrial ribosomal protein subunit